MKKILVAVLCLCAVAACPSDEPAQNNINVQGAVPTYDTTPGPDVVVLVTPCTTDAECTAYQLCYVDEDASEAQGMAISYCRTGCAEIMQSSVTLDDEGHTIIESWPVDSCARKGDALGCGDDNLCHEVEVEAPVDDDDDDPVLECALGSCESTGECTGALGAGYACISGCCEEVATGDDDEEPVVDDDTADDDTADDDTASVCELGSCGSTDECTGALGVGYVCRAGCCSSVSPGDDDAGDDDVADDDDTAVPPEPTYIEVTCYFAAAHATEGARFNVSWSTSTTLAPEAWDHRWDLPLTLVDGVAVGTVSARRADVAIGFWVELTDGSYTGRNWMGVAGTPIGCRIDGDVATVSAHRPDCGFAVGDAVGIDGC